MDTRGCVNLLPLTESISKVEEIIILYNMSSAVLTDSCNVARSVRSSGSGRFLIMALRRSTRVSDIPSAAKDGIVKVSSEVNAMTQRGRWWEGRRVTHGLDRECGGRAGVSEGSLR